MKHRICEEYLTLFNPNGTFRKTQKNKLLQKLAFQPLDVNSYTAIVDHASVTTIICINDPHDYAESTKDDECELHIQGQGPIPIVYMKPANLLPMACKFKTILCTAGNKKRLQALIKTHQLSELSKSISQELVYSVSLRSISPGYSNLIVIDAEDTDVYIQAATISHDIPVPMRLVGGGSPSEGRVEVYYNGQWGTVCHDYWHNVDAGVVCRGLGYGSSGSARLYATFGQGTGPIWLDRVACRGYEYNLANCTHPGYGVLYNCYHYKDAGVVCNSDVRRVPIRLVDGTNVSEGRVEIYWQNQWSTVCDDLWDDNDASVVCKQLGYSGGSARSNAFYGEGVGIILLDDVECYGNESSLFDCKHRDFELNDCRHKEDAGVICDGEPIRVRLVGGSSSNEGRVEVYYNGEWGSVCNDVWDDADAGVVCRELGLGSSGRSAYFGSIGNPVLLGDVVCSDNDMVLAHCGHNGVNITGKCSGLAGVKCYGEVAISPTSAVVYTMESTRLSKVSAAITPTSTPIPDIVPMRLVGGGSPSEGRVEVYYNGQWGTVCDDYWHNIDAGVVCRGLGFGSSGRATYSATFGQGTGPIWLDGISCRGNEYNLANCTHLGYGVLYSCSHREDAGVVCNSDVRRVPIRLVDGTNVSEGRVEIYWQNQWSTVCDDLWDDNDASVVCKQLGYSGGSARSNAFYGEGVGIILLDDVECYGNESSLFDCKHRDFELNDCRHKEDAGVICDGEPIRVRLVGGSSSNEGRVEVYYNGEWGSVCNDVWDDADAGVVCRELGLGSSGRSAYFGSIGNPVLLGDVVCSDNDMVLAHCGHNGVNITGKRSGLAGVKCYGNYTSVYIRVFKV
ncbi:deleted in malignant brain tumors 1 protein-like [Dysidea avara]|uniref:deleted in malignant brain tumors 1 protein-like n=1 Tax=Dysidea avara TaxID=196820 RepID=UPI00331E3B10